MNMKQINLDDFSISYELFGEGKVNLVIEIGLGSTGGEWYHIGKTLSEKYSVLLYERNKSTSTKRTPKRIAEELYILLGKIPHEEQLIIIAHSQGGLYAQQFTRLYPNIVKGLVLLDPLSANDNSYKEILTTKEQKSSGFDKSSNLKIMLFLATIHLGSIIKAVMKKAPPFYYYPNFSKEASNYILSAITKKSLYQSAIEEYKLAHDENELSLLKTKEGFPNIPIVLITHSSEFETKEIEDFGGTTEEFASKVEDIWQSLMKQYLSFSTLSKHIQADHSGHFIHLTEQQLIWDGLLYIKQETMASL